MKNAPKETPDVADDSLLCPIFDCDGQEINVGDLFTYQFETAYAPVATIKILNGVEWISFTDGTPSVPLKDFWYAKTDEKLTKKCVTQKPRLYEQTDHIIALQRSIEYHCQGEKVPKEIAIQCPYHAKMLDESL